MQLAASGLAVGTAWAGGSAHVSAVKLCSLCLHVSQQAQLSNTKQVHHYLN